MKKRNKKPPKPRYISPVEKAWNAAAVKIPVSKKAYYGTLARN